MNRKSTFDSKSFLLRNLSQFYHNNIPEYGYKYAMTATKDIISEYENSIRKRKKKATKSPILDLISKYQRKLSLEQISYFEKIDELYANTDDPNVFVNECTSLQNEIRTTLKQEDAQPLLVSLEVAKNSAEYWSKNLTLWADKLQGNKRKKGWFSWKSVGKGDVAGAGGAAVGAFVVNVIPALGQVAYGGAIVGGGVSGSAYSAINQILSHWD
ncbi:hypothetical protein K4L44_16835 [Halosquirtibacter laminarini]|uniref:Uncharacterized protein n=1 Tax=Halosquirtibacter laminarini TaxID=3374600 RepID=A0AC61NF44_9BACT|nr:hypothetical protein K4L44_16835 [Prolixibacteraceae bacterium]